MAADDPPGGWTLVTAVGDLDLAGAPLLHDRLLTLALSGRHRLVVDLGGASYCDLTGFAVLSYTERYLAARGGSLRIVIPPPDGRLSRALALLGVGTAFDVFPDRASAMTH